MEQIVAFIIGVLLGFLIMLAGLLIRWLRWEIKYREAVREIRLNKAQMEDKRSINDIREEYGLGPLGGDNEKNSL